MGEEERPVSRCSVVAGVDLMEALSRDFKRFVLDVEIVAQSEEGMGEAESAIARGALEIQRLALERAC